MEMIRRMIRCAVANYFADYFAINVALDIGGQRVHDLLEEDHQYHTSIEK